MPPPLSNGDTPITPNNGQFYTFRDSRGFVHTQNIPVTQQEIDHVYTAMYTVQSGRGKITQTKLKPLIIKGKAKTITSPRTFGVEIECVVPHDRSQLVHESINPIADYGTDGSVKGDGDCREIRTGVFKGADGERKLRHICHTLLQNHVETNPTCGLHIHLGTEKIKDDGRATWKVTIFYLLFDDVITAMLPPYRRGNNYARTFKYSCCIGDVLKANCLEELFATFYKNRSSEQIAQIRSDRKGDFRYYGINLHSLFSTQMNTLEIRYHSPTIQAQKILNWIALHQAILDTIPNVDSAILKGCANLLFFEDKLRTFFELLKLPKSLRNYVEQRIALFNPTYHPCVA